MTQDNLDNLSPAGRDYSYAETVKEFQLGSAPRQRALLSMLAISEEYGIDKSLLVSSLAQDQPKIFFESRRKTGRNFRQKLLRLAEAFEKDGEDTDKPIQAIPKLLPIAMLLGRKLERDQGNLSSLNQAWLDRHSETFQTDRPEDLLASRIMRLAARSLVVLFFASTIMIRVFPEFSAMLSEFGIEEPPVFQMANTFVNGFMKLWFFVPLLIMCMAPFFFPTFVHYLRRWNPFVWRQPNFSSSTRRRRILALISQSGTSVYSGVKSLMGFKAAKLSYKKLQKTKDRMDEGVNEWTSLASQKFISKQDARALALTASPETHAWILRRVATNNEHLRSRRSLYLVRLLVIVVNFILGALIILLTFSVLSVLLTIIQSFV